MGGALRSMLTAGLLSALAGVAIAAPPDLTGIWTLQANGKAGAALNGPGDF